MAMAPILGFGRPLCDRDKRHPPELALTDMPDLPAGTLPVSVIVPAYERADMLPRAIASVRSQRTAQPAEIIVVDDGSGDDTAEVAAELGARVIRHAQNQGTAHARNSGVRAASQPWLALLDSDDEWLPDHLATVWDLRDGHVLAAASALRWEPVARRRIVHGPAGKDPVVLRSPASLVFPGNLLPASGVLVRRDVVLDVGGFRRPDTVEDFDLWLRVLERGTGVITPRVTLVYHLHDAQSTGDAARMQARHVLVANRCAGRPWWSPVLVERWQATAAWSNVRSAVRRGDVRRASRNAAWIAARPRRVVAVARGSLVRARLKRRTREALRSGVHPHIGLPPRARGPEKSAAHRGPGA
jgi:glycosyltransferase involved in cell wall biosynthesis